MFTMVLMAIMLLFTPAAADVGHKTPAECRSWCASVGCAHEAECVGECLRGNLNVHCGGEDAGDKTEDQLIDDLMDEVDEVWTTTCSLKCLKCPFDKVSLCENQCQSKCSPHCCGCAKNVKGTSDCPLGACAFCPGVTDGDGKTACDKLAEEAEAEAEADPAPEESCSSKCKHCGDEYPSCVLGCEAGLGVHCG